MGRIAPIVAALVLGCASTRATVVTPARPPTAPRPTVVLVDHGMLAPTDEPALVARVTAAFTFALRACGWSTPAELAAAPLELHVTTLPRGTMARTSGPRAFSVSADVLRDADADGVLAHELTHLLDFRAARRGLRSIPRYLEEGRALTVGREFRRTLGRCADDLERIRVIESLTATQATEALAGFRDGAGLELAKRSGATFRWMTVSAFFLEFVRTRRPDAMARLSRVWERVGAGEPFDPAFTAEFSVPLSTLEADFVTFVHRTENDPAARLRGTAYAASCPGP